MKFINLNAMLMVGMAVAFSGADAFAQSYSGYGYAVPMGSVPVMRGSNAVCYPTGSFGYSAVGVNAGFGSPCYQPSVPGCTTGACGIRPGMGGMTGTSYAPYGRPVILPGNWNSGGRQPISRMVPYGNVGYGQPVNRMPASVPVYSPVYGQPVIVNPVAPRGFGVSPGGYPPAGSRLIAPRVPVVPSSRIVPVPRGGDPFYR